MEDQLKNLKQALDLLPQLMEEVNSLKKENEALKKHLEDIENQYLLCKKELRYVRDLKNRALKKLEKVLNLVDEFL